MLSAAAASTCHKVVLRGLAYLSYPSLERRRTPDPPRMVGPDHLRSDSPAVARRSLPLPLPLPFTFNSKYPRFFPNTHPPSQPTMSASLLARNVLSRNAAIRGAALRQPQVQARRQIRECGVRGYKRERERWTGSDWGGGAQAKGDRLTWTTIFLQTSKTLCKRKGALYSSHTPHALEQPSTSTDTRPLKSRWTPISGNVRRPASSSQQTRRDRVRAG